MSESIIVPTTQKKPDQAGPKLSAVERSLTRVDAFAKPGSVGKPQGSKGVRVRVAHAKPTGHKKMRKRDPRDVRFW